MRQRSKTDFAAGRPSDVLEIDDFPPFMIGVIANKIVASGSRLYRRHFGVGFTEWRILAMLALEPGATAKRICDVVGMDKAAASRGLVELESGGHIEVTPETAHKRSRCYTLTEAGRLLHDRLLKVTRAREERLLARLSTQERVQLVGYLRRLMSQLDEVESFSI